MEKCWSWSPTWGSLCFFFFLIYSWFSSTPPLSTPSSSWCLCLNIILALAGKNVMPASTGRSNKSFSLHHVFYLLLDRIFYDFYRTFCHHKDIKLWFNAKASGFVFFFLKIICVISLRPVSWCWFWPLPVPSAWEYGNVSGTYRS